MVSSPPQSEDPAGRLPGFPGARRRAPRKATAKHLENVALGYLARFQATARSLERVLHRRVLASARHHGTDAAQGRAWIAELSAIAKHLQTRPKTAIDFSNVSGEYCFSLGLGKAAHMTHYAIDPAGTSEDVIDFVNAKPLLAAGINVERLGPAGTRPWRRSLPPWHRA